MREAFVITCVSIKFTFSSRVFGHPSEASKPRSDGDKKEEREIYPENPGLDEYFDKISRRI